LTFWVFGTQLASSRNIALFTNPGLHRPPHGAPIRCQGVFNMAQVSHPGTVRAVGAFPARPAHQAYLILYVGFLVLPILAGLDKFFHVLVNWDQYLTPLVPQILSISAHNFMFIVGVIEIIAGLLVAFRPQIGAYVVTVWLWGIIINLLLIPGYYDIALRDFGLSLGALALARLSGEFGSASGLRW
jgi:hypothetical protein